MRNIMALGACLMATAALATVAEGATSGLHGCGDKPKYLAYSIKADFSCKKGYRVVRGWYRMAIHGGDGDGYVKGFRCNYRSTGYEVGKIRCKTKNRKVKWITGS